MGGEVRKRRIGGVGRVVVSPAMVRREEEGKQIAEGR